VPSAVATRTSSPIRIDGVLDEDAWGQARPIGPLTEREPRERETATEWL
jgi:hypothetical protein